MSDAAPIQARLAAVVPLGAYVLLRGLDATVLKGLQQLGAAHAVNGENPISFCNVFFMAELLVGLAALRGGARRLPRELRSLNRAGWGLVALGGGLGLFLGPIAYFLELQSLSVVSQTLLFSVVLPASALLARGVLAEPLPRGFGLSTALIGAGLLLPALAMVEAGQPAGGEVVSLRGLPSTLSALLFGLIALILFGPQHFLLLQLWWVVGVIGIYALTLTLGREVSLRLAYRRCGVATVSLWGSLAIVVASLSAALLLGERITAATATGLALILLGAMRTPLAMRSDGTVRGYLP